MSTPKVAISAGGADITAAITDRIVYINYHEETNFQLDRLDIELDDREPHVVVPMDGLNLGFQIGYAESGLVDKGTFYVAEVTLSSPPQQVLIVAQAYDMAKNIKGGRNQSYHKKTIGDIVGTIAGRLGLSAVVDGSMSGTLIPHRDQAGQSDMAFLSHLAHDNGAQLRIKNGMLVFVPWGTANAVTGESVSNTTISQKDCLNWSWKHQVRGKYLQGNVGYHNPDTGEEKRVTSGGGSGAGDYMIQDLQATFEEAKRKAKASIEGAERAIGTFTFTCVGRPELGAGTFVTLADFRSDIPTSWWIETCDHTYDYKGYHTKCVCVTPPSGGSGGGDGGGGGGADQSTPGVDPSAEPSEDSISG